MADSTCDQLSRTLFDIFIQANPSVLFIRYQWLDFSGVLRQRTLTKSHCTDLLDENRCYGVGPALMLFNISNTTLDDRPRKELFDLRPDWTSLKVCHYAPGHAVVMCFAYCQDSPEPRALCPRHLLSKVLHQSEQYCGIIQYLVGFEVEFHLLDSAMNHPTGVDDVEGWSTAAGLRGERLEIVEEVVALLHASDIHVQHFHTEDRHQLEISTGPLPPMQAIDAVLYTYETVRTVAIRHGLRATMTPKPNAGAAPNGAHIHLSLSSVTNQDHFLAGVLGKLPVLCAFGMPNVDSYYRVHARKDYTGALVGWGTQNRSLPIRKIHDGHWELRFVDATANFYMLLAFVIDAGLTGIRECHELKWKDSRMAPIAMSEEQLFQHGLSERLPMNLKESLAILRSDSSAERVLGSWMKKRYLDVKMKDEEALGNMTEEDRRRLFIKYF